MSMSVKVQRLHLVQWTDGRRLRGAVARGETTVWPPMMHEYPKRSHNVFQEIMIGISQPIILQRNVHWIS